MNRQDGIEKHKISMYGRGSLIGIGLVDVDDTKQHLLLSPQQIQLLHILQQNQAHLNAQQLQTLRHLQETYAILQQGGGKMPQRVVETQNSNPVTEAVPREAPPPPPPPPPPPLLPAAIASTSELSLRTSPLSELPQVTQEDLQAFLGITGDQDDLSNGLTDQDGRQKLREPKSDPMLAAGPLFPVSLTAQEKLIPSQVARHYECLCYNTITSN
ncbi:unnamed protein product [Soboliphyme baturini]|uniref:CSTF_C domain-containing protein n=1 Tax=Soboliphyme baturini TaxID=241478 RepID=A0A183JAU8_9BILA|nr:unnamed protein product [Soboliphyme baturini]